MCWEGRVRSAPRPIRYFFLRGVCASADAIGPRSRFGVLGLRKSLPACDASFLEVLILLFSFVSILQVRAVIGPS